MNTIATVLLASTFISGINPELHTFNREGECGTGAVVPWAGSLWAISYAPHMPNKSTDLLYEVKPDFTRVIHKDVAIGGTPANRLIHKESNQLFIGPYAIDAKKQIRVMKPVNDDGTTNLYGRLTASARHLTDPANKIYTMTMEEGVYEIDVQTLKVTELFRDGNIQGYGKHDGVLLPGYHGKGGYSGQGRLVYANNGEFSLAAMKDPTTTSGVLAQWNGKPCAENWEVVLRNQFTDITSKGGIYGAANPEKDPLWAIGWDYRSVILMILEDGQWHKYRLPKGSHSYDGAHGWNTEWPRIREIGEGDDFLMTMHGTFWHFPATMSVKSSAGIRPRSNYLKIVGDFCRWGDKVVLGCDDTAANEFLNKRKAKGSIGAPGQSNSSLWFLDPSDFDTFGPVIGRGAVWQAEDVKAGTVSDPYLYDGYDRHLLQVVMDGEGALEIEVDRKGDGNWEPFSKYLYDPNSALVDLDTVKSAAWIRFKATTALKNATVFLNYANVDRREVRTSVQTETKAILRSGRGDENLKFEAVQGDDYYVMLPGEGGKLELKKTDDAEAKADTVKWFSLDKKEALGDTYDRASAMVTDDEGRCWRFPYATEEMRGKFVRQGRLCREVCTERDLLNIAGVFYELPAENAGGYAKMRAITTTGVAAYDYATWRGLFVIAGIRPATKKGVTVVSDDGKVSLWVGAADDLWDFGKPVGVGGPWYKTAAKAGVASDPYLLAGFDGKEVSVTADREVKITLECDVTGTGVWARIGTLSVTADKEVVQDISDVRGYWLRAVADRDCQATVQLTYR